MTRARWVVLAAVSLLALADSLSPTVHGTSALFTAGTGAGTQTVTGGTFSTPVAPVVSRTVRGANVTLAWTAVGFSSGATVSYLVTRIHPDGSRVSVCTGADSPVFSGPTVTCTDRKPPSGSTYTEQPVLLNAGQATWSLPPSLPA